MKPLHVSQGGYMSSPTELVWFCLFWSGLVSSGLVCFRLFWSGFFWSGLILHLFWSGPASGLWFFSAEA